MARFQSQPRPSGPQHRHPHPACRLAAEELHYNQISLRAEVSQEVARDMMIVTLYTESQNSDPAKLTPKSPPP